MRTGYSTTDSSATRPPANAWRLRCDTFRMRHACTLLLGAGFALLTACSRASTAAPAAESRPAIATQDAVMQEIEPGAKILVVGATGSVGRLVVAEALDAGYRVRALVRNRARAERMLPAQTTLVVGDLTAPDSLSAAVSGVDGIVFTHGSDSQARDVNYGGVRNVLFALDGRPVRVAMMSAVGVTRPIDASRIDIESRGWKRRGERLLRASGLLYTIVRPGWFDYNAADQQRMVFRQGDTPQTGTPRDGVIARQQIAEVLIASLASNAANRKTLELVAEQGQAQADLEPLFAALEPDVEAALDGPRDQDNLPLSGEPALFREDLQRIGRD